MTSYWFVEKGPSEVPGPLKILNGIKLILDDQGESLKLIYNQFGIIQVLQSSPILKPVTGQEFFFAVSYSKPALVVVPCWPKLWDDWVS